MKTKVSQLLTGLVIVFTASSGLAAPAGARLEPGWSRLTFKYSNFAVEAQADFVRQVMSSTDFTRSSTSMPGQLLPSGATVARITANSIFDLPILGRRRNDVLLWFDPVNYAALQSIRQRIGRKPKYKVSRYTESGVHRSKGMGNHFQTSWQ